jgi:hypothetical protein
MIKDWLACHDGVSSASNGVTTALRMGKWVTRNTWMNGQAFTQAVTS